MADVEGLQPLTVDFTLRRGVPVEVRLVNRDTGKPVRGALIYSPLRGNPLHPESQHPPGYEPNLEFREFGRFPDKDGIFRLTAYPGPGVIFGLANWEGRHYLPARPDPADEQKGHFAKDPNLMRFLPNAQGYRVVDTDRPEQTLKIDIQFDPGRRVQGFLVGPDARPVTGARAYGLSRDLVTEALKTGAFTVVGLDSDPRTVSFAHKDRKLIGFVVAKGSEKSPVRVSLVSWGAVKGRLADEQGKPLRGVRLQLHYPKMPSPGLRPPDPEVQTDSEGAFRVEGLVPGLKHTLTLRDAAGKEGTLSAGDALQGLTARAGEVRELGEVRVRATPAKKGKEGGDE